VCQHDFVPKVLSREQLQSRKDKAVRFTRDVLNDPERAEEIADESLEDYAERRKMQIANPCGRRRGIMATKQELLDQIAAVEDENQQLQDQLDAVADIVSPDDGNGDDDNNGDDGTGDNGGDDDQD